MIDLFYAFIILGLFKLAQLVWSDLKSLSVDERHSTFMMGVVTLMFFMSNRLLEMMAIIFISQFLLGKLKEKKWLTGLGNGDLSILAWVISGLWFFGTNYIVIFMATYVLILLYMNNIAKIKHIPVTIPIVIGFVIVWTAQAIGVLI